MERGGASAIDWKLNYKYFLNESQHFDSNAPITFWMLKNHPVHMWFLFFCIHQFIFSCFAFLLVFTHPSLPIMFQVGDFRELPSHHPRAAPNFPEHVSFVG